MFYFLGPSFQQIDGFMAIFGGAVLNLGCIELDSKATSMALCQN